MALTEGCRSSRLQERRSQVQPTAGGNNNQETASHLHGTCADCFLAIVPNNAAQLLLQHGDCIGNNKPPRDGGKDTG